MDVRSPWKITKPTQPAFNVDPSSARQGNAIKMAFHRRADDGPPLKLYTGFS